MATSYYQPTSANHNTAPRYSPPQRGHRICDQCGTIETPSVRFRLCGGCMTTQYCSQTCQKTHWSVHKKICQFQTKQTSSNASAKLSVDEVPKYLRKFTSAHSSLLAWAGYQALQLKRMPANIKQRALLVDLSYHEDVDLLHRFSISSTHVVPRSYVNDPLVKADIQRREERCRQNGGIGALVVIIQCGTISQVMPVEVDLPSKISWDYRDDWAQVLSAFVESGRTDFKPNSTPPGGSYVFSPGPSPLAQSIVSQPHSKQQHPYLSYSPFAPNPNTPRATAGVQNTLVDAIDIDPASINGPRSSSSPSDPSELTPIFVDSDSDTDFDMHEDCNSRVGGKHDSDSEMLCRSRPLDIVDCDRSEHFQTTTCWIAAEHALQHARSNMTSVSEVFNRWQIQKSEYVVLAGFDESLIKAGVGYLEQIHVLVSAKVDATSPLLSELGRVFSPFSSILFTDTASYRIPVFKDDGSVWEFDELAYSTSSKFADAGSSAKAPLTVISLCQSPSLAGSPSGFSQGSSGSEGGSNEKRKSDKGKERDCGDEDEADAGDKDNEDPDDDPDDPSGGGIIARPAKISFAIVSKIYPIQDKMTAFQTLTVQGSLTVKTTQLGPQSPDPFSTRRVRFTELTFGTHRTMEMAYAQFYVRVIINSKQENAGIEVIRPKRTLASEREEWQSSVKKVGKSHGMTVGLTIGPHPQGAITGAAMKTNEKTASREKKRYTSRITEQHDDGVVEWGFDVDDLYEQERGIDMSDDVLPTVCFEFVGDPKVPPPPPERMDVEISSYWSMIPRSGTESNWIHTFLNVPRSSGNTEATSYSNICQIVALEIAPVDLQPRSDYRATMHVSPGVPDTDYISYYPEVRLPTSDSVTVTPEFTIDDWRKINAFKLPMLTELKLSDYFKQTFAKSGSDSKSQ